MKGIVLLGAIPMRKEPSDRSEMVNQVIFGETFEILERAEKWSKIKLQHDKYEGWVDNKQYDLLKGNLVNKESVVGKLFVKKENLILPMGSYFPSPGNTPTTIVKTAKQFLGSPYLWGGRTFMGIDCSGFTQIVFRVNGIKLLRDSSQQQSQGRKIKFADAATNDLAFFSNAEGKVIHVGIILKEKDKTKIIHASGRVRMDVLDEKGILNEETQTYSHNFHSIKRIR